MKSMSALCATLLIASLMTSSPSFAAKKKRLLPDNPPIVVSPAKPDPTAKQLPIQAQIDLLNCKPAEEFLAVQKKIEKMGGVDTNLALMAPFFGIRDEFLMMYSYKDGSATVAFTMDKGKTVCRLPALGTFEIDFGVLLRDGSGGQEGSDERNAQNN